MSDVEIVDGSGGEAARDEKRLEKAMFEFAALLSADKELQHEADRLVRIVLAKGKHKNPDVSPHTIRHAVLNLSEFAVQKYIAKTALG